MCVDPATAAGPYGPCNALCFVVDATAPDKPMPYGTDGTAVVLLDADPATGMLGSWSHCIE